MDIRMSAMDGIEATRTIRGDESLAQVRLIVLTTFELHDHVLDAIRAGAVKTHVSRAPIRLDARDRAQLVTIFFQGNDHPLKRGVLEHGQRANRRWIDRLPLPRPRQRR